MGMQREIRLCLSIIVWWSVIQEELRQNILLSGLRKICWMGFGKSRWGLPTIGEFMVYVKSKFSISPNWV